MKAERLLQKLLHKPGEKWLLGPRKWRGAGEKQLETGYFLKVASSVFAQGLDEECKNGISSWKETSYHIP